uniref:NADH dehydrogenase subunit 5 n=1 Tax=Xenostrobus securis TaxID=1289581 RepID=UPI00226C92E0|nr:NADH dehydrogenase subunit 5 [Xenostrobus securis]UZG65995.1 NADH dehydrogenase subunit 5 [Xenostrobus securis]
MVFSKISGFRGWAVFGICMNVLGFLCLLISPFVGSFCLDYVVWWSDLAPVFVSLLVDSSSVVFLSTVLVISGSVFLYCSWYMECEVFYGRFMMLVLGFVMSMVCLIFFSNLVTLLLGWDGLGIISFALVIYYQNNKSLGAGMVTALINRIGDVFLLATIGVMFKNGGWLMYSSSPLFCKYVGVLLFLAAITKSAQMPFSSWLPAAMAAPTPVSALVHSSTLVTAGVYLLYRCYPVVSTSSVTMEFLKIVSVMTLVMAGSSALMESDFKKIIALSTLSQLSMMLFSIASCAPDIGFFHLVAHATFKALLFLCAGVVIHNNYSYQDMRVISQSWRKMPVSSACLMVANLALCGCPFLSGFFSKDLIIELSLWQGDQLLVYVFLVVGSLLSSLYSMRMSMFILFGGSNLGRLSFSLESATVKGSYVSLLVMAVMGGFVLSAINEKFSEALVVSELESVLVFLLIASVLMSYEMVTLSMSSSKMFGRVGRVFSSMWGLKPLFSHFMPYFGLEASGLVLKSLEKGWLEKCGPYGALYQVSFMVHLNQQIQSVNFLKMAWGFMLVGSVAFLFGCML